MKRVFLVSCIWFKGQKESIFLKEALEKRGIKTNLVLWEDSTVDWSSADLAISRTTSSYLYDPQKFLEWAEKVEEKTTLWNSSKVMRWNHHKRYIIELQDKGINVPGTILIPENIDETFENIIDEIPWDDFVIKPCISAGSCGLKRFNKDSPDLENHFYSVNRDGYKVDYPGLGILSFGSTDTLVQPFLPEISQYGEASLFYFGDKFSHSVIKKVKKGDYRANPDWGAEVHIYEPSERLIETGHMVIDAVGYPTHFARLDIIPSDNRPIVIEVELIDPMMYFNLLPETTENYADHIFDYLNR